VTLVGSGAEGNADGVGTSASFAKAGGITADSNGHVFIADSSNNKIRLLVASGTTQYLYLICFFWSLKYQLLRVACVAACDIGFWYDSSEALCKPSLPGK
jgi:hypothetical protein